MQRLRLDGCRPRALSCSLIELGGRLERTVHRKHGEQRSRRRSARPRRSRRRPRHSAAYPRCRRTASAPARCRPWPGARSRRTGERGLAPGRAARLRHDRGDEHRPAAPGWAARTRSAFLSSVIIRSPNTTASAAVQMFLEQTRGHRPVAMPSVLLLPADQTFQFIEPDVDVVRALQMGLGGAHGGGDVLDGSCPYPRRRRGSWPCRVPLPPQERLVEAWQETKFTFS